MKRGGMALRCVAASDAGGAARALVRGVLERVVERAQRAVEAERLLDEPVGEPRVLREERAVEVRPDDETLADALEPARPGVPVAAQDPPEGGDALAEVRAAPVVLE